MYKRKDVVLSAKQGYYFNLIDVDIIISITILFLFVSVLAGIASIIAQDAELFLYSFCLFLLIFIASLPTLIRDFKMTKYLKNCLNDVVKLTATVKVVDNYFYDMQCIIIFKYNNNDIKIVSAGFKKLKFNNGKSVLKKYIGKKINILYSPSMNDVLILKKQDN